jgi:hypothetical protein
VKIASIILAIVIVGAAAFFFIYDPSTPIADILNNPRDFEGKSLTISGEVTGGSNLLVFKYYSLRDETGEIRVITERLVPSSGARIKVHGRVEQAFQLGEVKVVVFREESS